MIQLNKNKLFLKQYLGNFKCFKFMFLEARAPLGLARVKIKKGSEPKCFK